MATIVVADIGSTWAGKREYGKEAIKICSDIGVDACKFQLFDEEHAKGGNIILPFDLFTEFYQYGKEVGCQVTASVFNTKALEFLLSFPDLHHVKFGYSQRLNTKPIQGALNVGRTVAVTTNVMDAFKLPIHKELKKLYTSIDSNGVLYPSMIYNNFDALFPTRFQGFSDHSLGTEESRRASSYGCYWFERHLRLTYSDCDDCPDGKFALLPKQLAEFIKWVKP